VPLPNGNGEGLEHNKEVPSSIILLVLIIEDDILRRGIRLVVPTRPPRHNRGRRELGICLTHDFLRKFPIIF